MKKIKIWDAATRIFHWALVLNIFAAWYTIENRLIELHEIFGHCLIALLVFRVLWGLIGSSTARFTHFLVHPVAALSYLKQSLRLQTHHQIGHNPAGGWMIIVMMLVIGFQLVSGLLSNNDLGFSGVLSDYVSKEMSDTFTQLHSINFEILVGSIWLHLVAVFFYVLVKKDNLIKTLLTGKKQLTKPLNQAAESALYFAPVRLGVICLLVACGFVYWLYQ
jgi:cytochrome b